MAPRQPPRRQTADTSGRNLSLHEVSERLGVHYMTVYRYVRTGRLPATKPDGRWEVDSRHLDRLRSPAVLSAGRRGRPAYAGRVSELVRRLVAGDEGGAWALTESVLAGGASPSDLYLRLFVPALRMIGESWQRGDISVADEHCATVVMQRLVGRMGPLFRRPGRTRGIVVLGAPEGDLHGLPTALAADVLRADGFVVIDLGANVPTQSFVDCVQRLPRVIAVGIAVTTLGREAVAGRLVAELRAFARVPIIVGGSGIDEAGARRLGADQWADSAQRLLRRVREI